jgi:hypothetical protein
MLVVGGDVTLALSDTLALGLLDAPSVRLLVGVGSELGVGKRLALGDGVLV